MKKIFNKIRTSIWLYPGIHGLIALFLSITITIIDQTYNEVTSPYINSAFYTTSSLATMPIGSSASIIITHFILELFII